MSWSMVELEAVIMESLLKQEEELTRLGITKEMYPVYVDVIKLRVLRSLVNEW